MNNQSEKKYNRNKTVSCPDCHQQIHSKDIKQHIITCLQYRSTYVCNIIRLIDYTDTTDLKFLAAEMQISKQKLEDKIEANESKVKNNSNAKKQEINSRYQDKNIYKYEFNLQQYNKKQSHQINQQKNKEKKIIVNKLKQQFQKSNNLDKSQKFEKNESNQNQILQSLKQENNHVIHEQNICLKCLKDIQYNNFTFGDSCMHLICILCLKEHIKKQYVRSQENLKCPINGCNLIIPQFQVQQVIGDQQFQKLNKTRIQIMMGLIQCIKCKEMFKFQKGKSQQAPKKNQQGITISTFQAQHFANNRFQCPNCKTNQCKQCHETPYHLGFSCEQYQRKKAMKKCRYCDGVIPLGYMSSVGISTFDDICENRQCQLLVKEACSKRLPCKHPCLGYARQKQCPPCLWQECLNSISKSEEKYVSSNSECSICFTQYAAAPCVRSKCGHTFHLRCLRNTFEIKWITPRIFFNFCKCPLCKQWIQLPQQCPLTKKLNQFKKLYEEIREKSVKRLKFQGADKDLKVTDKASIYFNKPQLYAVAIYAYFECFKCKKPYFGGRKNCSEVMNDNKSQFDQKQLICPSCCPIAIKDCKKHGKQFISFKCKFCCSIAEFFCWGNTHFCGQCHKKQCSGTYISKLPIEKLPKCEGVEKCPAGGNHDGNGAQLCLGCMLCRNYKQSMSDF